MTEEFLNIDNAGVHANGLKSTTIIETRGDDEVIRQVEQSRESESNHNKGFTNGSNQPQNPKDIGYDRRTDRSTSSSRSGSYHRHRRHRGHSRSRSRHRHNSSSPSPHHSRHRHHRHHHDRHRYRHDDSRSYESRRRSPSPQLTEEQRDRRTVFVQQLAARLTERELKVFMERVGKVRSVKIVTDRVTGRSKGFGYVEYYEEQSVPLGIVMSGEKLLGIPILISYTETEKNRLAAEAEAAKKNRLQGSDYCQIQIKNVHCQIKEDGLRVILQPFGYLESISMRRDTYKPNGEVMTWVAQVVFKDHRNAKHAVEQLDGFELAGLKLQVTPVTLSTKSASDTLPSGLDDGDGAGMVMSSQARTELMMKLARDTDLVSKIPGIQSPNEIATQYIAIINAYDPETETDPNWANALCEDIRSECVKFGDILHIQVLKSKAGEVYIKYGDMASSQVAKASLNGRWFGGRQLAVKYIPSNVFQTKTGYI